MNKALKYSGIALIVVGVIIFAVDYFAFFNSNALLLTGLAAILIGVAVQIVVMKKAGDGSEG